MKTLISTALALVLIIPMAVACMLIWGIIGLLDWAEGREQNLK